MDTERIMKELSVLHKEKTAALINGVMSFTKNNDPGHAIDYLDEMVHEKVDPILERRELAKQLLCLKEITRIHGKEPFSRVKLIAIVKEVYSPELTTLREWRSKVEDIAVRFHIQSTGEDHQDLVKLPPKTEILLNNIEPRELLIALE